MDKLSQMVVLLCVTSNVMGGSLSGDSLVASIDEVQRKFGTTAADKRISTGNVRHADANEMKSGSAVHRSHDNAIVDDDDVVGVDEHLAHTAADKTRHNKMFDFYRYYAPSPAYPPMPFYNPFYSSYYQQQPPPLPPPYMPGYYPPYYPSGTEPMDGVQQTDEYAPEEDYEGDENDLGDESDDGSRANTKRRPSNKQNSPIFYIRLPPTPYMFVPGMGYISQPPTIQPLTPQYPMNPFINLPINYVSNAKPTGVYPWSTQPPSNYGAAPQFPSYLPPRPHKHRPSQKPSVQSDSKITHLGSYLFNGRPENIYLMPPYHNPYASPYHHIPPNPYQPLPPTPYNSFPSIYGPAPTIPNYY